jgi:hypothetical protein
MSRSHPFALVLAVLLTAAGCSSRDSNDQGETSRFANLAEEAGREIREEFATEDMDLSHGGGHPSARLSPQGDLIIGGEKVAMTDEQREIALRYRESLADVAETGARLGIESAGLAGDALKLAAASVFNGDERSLEEQMKGKTEAIEAQAMALCRRLPELLARQQQFAAAVPEFAPYARMDQDDVEQCGDVNKTTP